MNIKYSKQTKKFISPKYVKEYLEPDEPGDVDLKMLEEIENNSDCWDFNWKCKAAK